MDAFSPETALQAWKKQLDAGFRVIETLTEAAERLHETQLEAAAAAHADAVATQQAASRAKDPGELMQLQMQWARANTEKSLAYWRALYENAAQTGQELAACLAGADSREKGK